METRTRQSDDRKRKTASYAEGMKPLPPPKPKISIPLSKHKASSASSLALVLMDNLPNSSKSKATKKKQKSHSHGESHVEMQLEVIKEQKKKTNPNIFAEMIANHRILRTTEVDPKEEVAASPERLSPNPASITSPGEEQELSKVNRPSSQADEDQDSAELAHQSDETNTMTTDLSRTTEVCLPNGTPRQDAWERLESDTSHYEEIPASLRENMLLTSPPTETTYEHIDANYWEGQTQDIHKAAEPKTLNLVPTSGYVTLKEVMNSLNIQLPQLAEVKKGFTCPVGGSVAHGDILLLVDRRKVTAVNGTCDENGQSVHLLQNSKHQLSPASEELQTSELLSVENLLSSKRLPPVVSVMETFTAAKGQTISKGTLLFFDRDAKHQSRLSRKTYLKAKDSNGTSILISNTSKATFSVNSEDISMFLPEIIHHFKFPAKFQVHVDPAPKVVTLESVCQQDILVAQPFDREKGKPKLQYIQIPISWDVTVQPVSIQDDEDPYTIAHYCSFRQRSKTEPNLDESSGYDYVNDWLPALRLQLKQDHPPSPPQASTEPPVLSPKENARVDTTPEENISFLKTLNPPEVLQLLEGLGMQEHQVHFQREKVDGEVLSSLNEDDLEMELNISSHIHRLRLLKVIDGHSSAQQILAQLYI